MHGPPHGNPAPVSRVEKESAISFAAQVSCLGDNLVPAIRILPAGREKGTRKPDFCYVSAESGSTRDQPP